MFRSLTEKIWESTRSVFPISAIVFLLHFTIAPMPLGTVALFLSGTVLLILGMSVFTLGADQAMIPIGEHIGSGLTKSRKVWILIVGSFLLGALVTIAEPDLLVLSTQVPSVPDTVMILSVAAGVGLFLVVAMLRILFQIRLAYIFLSMYALVFLLAIFSPNGFLGVAFDAGGVTTGPITVPFILALGTGVSAVRGGKSAEEDSFGLCAVSSIGPVLSMLVLGLFFDPSGTGYAYETPDSVNSIGELISVYTGGFLSFFVEVAAALAPIFVIFLLYQAFKLRLPKTQLIKILIGIVYIVVGLTIFLVGVNIGFMPAGTFLGARIASLPYRWILIPLSMALGFFVVAAEPAVHILNKQVEDVTAGSISRRMMMTGMSLGVSGALALAMIRIMTGISLWYILLPGYILALGLTFFVPDVFTAIAFDSGGVASGTMTAAFLLPFSLGACKALGGDVMNDAFGIVALVAMMPLVTIQIMGLVYKIKLYRSRKAEDTMERELPDGELSAGTDTDNVHMPDIWSDKEIHHTLPEETACTPEDVAMIEFPMEEDATHADS